MKRMPKVEGDFTTHILDYLKRQEIFWESREGGGRAPNPRIYAYSGVKYINGLFNKYFNTHLIKNSQKLLGTTRPQFKGKVRR